VVAAKTGPRKGYDVVWRDAAALLTTGAALARIGRAVLGAIFICAAVGREMAFRIIVLDLRRTPSARPVLRICDSYLAGADACALHRLQRAGEVPKDLLNTDARFDLPIALATGHYISRKDGG